MNLKAWIAKHQGCQRGQAYTKEMKWADVRNSCNRPDWHCVIMDYVYEDNCKDAEVQAEELWMRPWWQLFLRTLMGTEALLFMDYETMFYVFRGWDSYHRNRAPVGYFSANGVATWERATLVMRQWLNENLPDGPPDVD